MEGIEKKNKTKQIESKGKKVQKQEEQKKFVGDQGSKQNRAKSKLIKYNIMIYNLFFFFWLYQIGRAHV